MSSPAPEAGPRRKNKWDVSDDGAAKEGSPALVGNESGTGKEGSPAPADGPAKKRSRWETQDDVKAVLPGLGQAITLPASIAHLVPSPAAIELNMKLNQVIFMSV